MKKIKMLSPIGTKRTVRSEEGDIVRHDCPSCGSDTFVFTALGHYPPMVLGVS